MRLDLVTVFIPCGQMCYFMSENDQEKIFVQVMVNGNTVRVTAMRRTEITEFGSSGPGYLKLKFIFIKPVLSCRYGIFRNIFL